MDSAQAFWLDVVQHVAPKPDDFVQANESARRVFDSMRQAIEHCLTALDADRNSIQVARTPLKIILFYLPRIFSYILAELFFIMFIAIIIIILIRLTGIFSPLSDHKCY